ncbi:MAG TPA: hypothetical protein VHU79_02425 [Sphingomicrobium sp.]|nr:hypothetical protein [Sphingomicrobium sp.]
MPRLPRQPGSTRRSRSRSGQALELKKDGHFRYQLDYGAASDEAEGDWTFDGKIVCLTTRPMPKLPSFELVRDDPAPKGELAMTLEPPGFGEDFRIDAVAIDAATGEKGPVTTDAEGLVDSGARTLASVDPLVPVLRDHRGPFRAQPRSRPRSRFPVPRQ